MKNAIIIIILIIVIFTAVVIVPIVSIKERGGVKEQKKMISNDCQRACETLKSDYIKRKVYNFKGEECFCAKDNEVFQAY